MDPKKEKERISAGRMRNKFLRLNSQNPSQFAGPIITICQVIHLIMSQLVQKQMFLKLTNATIVITTLASANYLCNNVFQLE